MKYTADVVYTCLYTTRLSFRQHFKQYWYNAFFNGKQIAGGKPCVNIKHCRDDNINMANLQIQPAVKPSVKLAAKLIHIPR
jgi:hypothetical protein